MKNTFQNHPTLYNDSRTDQLSSCTIVSHH